MTRIDAARGVLDAIDIGALCVACFFALLTQHSCRLPSAPIRHFRAAIPSDLSIAAIVHHAEFICLIALALSATAMSVIEVSKLVRLSLGARHYQACSRAMPTPVWLLFSVRFGGRERSFAARR